MKVAALVAAVAVLAACGYEPDDVCTSADVSGILFLDPPNNPGAPTAALRVGQSVRVCMLGSDICTAPGQRFAFDSDAPAVVTVGMDLSEPRSACNLMDVAHPCCGIAVGRLTGVGPGTAHVQALLLNGGRIQKSAGLLWCPPMGPGNGCRPITAVEVTP